MVPGMWWKLVNQGQLLLELRFGGGRRTTWCKDEQWQKTNRFSGVWRWRIWSRGRRRARALYIPSVARSGFGSSKDEGQGQAKSEGKGEPPRTGSVGSSAIHVQGGEKKAPITTGTRRTAICFDKSQCHWLEHRRTMDPWRRPKAPWLWSRAYGRSVSYGREKLRESGPCGAKQGQAKGL